MAMRPRFQWQLGSRTLELGARTLVMGVVNVTPDSFSDGGRFLDADKAITHALKLFDEGADIVDIGGESTRPGRKEPVTPQQELERVLPVVEGVKKHAPQSLISVDTYRATTARACVAAGAEIVNDVSGLRWDAEMAGTLAELQCGVVLMHMRGRPEEWRKLPPLPDPLPLVKKELTEIASQAVSAGIARGRIVLDPGFGFGKSFNENYPLLAQFDKLHELGFPLLSGTSRKSFIGRTLASGGVDAPPKTRRAGTLAAVTASILKGAHIVRVHDVREATEAAKVADAVAAATGN
jgi:dihydropteroate synthase